MRLMIPVQVAPAHGAALMKRTIRAKRTDGKVEPSGKIIQLINS